MQQSIVNPLRIALLLQLAALALVLGWWLARAVPVSLVEPAVATSVLPCVSYAPFRRPGASPLVPDTAQAHVTPAQIEEDLRILTTRTNCVRTYGLGHGLDALPAIAARLGMRVRLGAWLGRDAGANQLEIERALALAREFKGTVELLIIGNEVLLRRELAPAQLAWHLDYARERSPVPVTYADVWEFWLRHAWLGAHVDLVTVHILPYWEDEPVAVADAVSHVLRVGTQVRQRFAGQPVWVGETGWPAAGRQRGAALPGRVEQARFVRELLQAAPGAALDYNLIEAFDQPWKRALEGAMGGYWGLFDQFGQARVAFAGDVVEDARWWRGWLGALAGALLGALFGALFFARFGVGFCERSGVLCGERWGVRSGVQAAPAILVAATLGAVLPVQWLMSQQWDRTLWEQSQSVLLTLIGAAAALATLHHQFSKIERVTRIALLFAASTAALVLLLDSRYRPFPWWWFLAPTVALLAARFSRFESSFHDGFEAARQRSAEERLLAAILAGCAAGIALAEGWRNAQALSYCAVLLVLAGTCGLPTPARWRTNTSTASSAAGAPSSVV